MAPMVTLYILAGCIAASIGLFIVMLVVSAMPVPRRMRIRTVPPNGQLPARALTRPSYPEWRPLKVVRFFIMLFAVCVVATCAAIAYPPLLDPLCEYQWFGSDAASTLRNYARAAHDGIAGLLPSR